MKDDPSLNGEMLRKFLKRPGRYPLLPRLTPPQQVALLCRVLYDEGYNDHIAGHISFRQPDGSFYANPWELRWDEVTAADILHLDAKGNIIEGEWNITPAINLHVGIYAARPDVNVVIHNHPEWGSVWAGVHRVPPAYDQTAAMVAPAPALYSDYQGTINKEAAGAGDPIAAFGDNKWAILANHGVLLAARDIRQAHLRALTLEWRCRLAWRVEALGGGVPLTPEAEQSVGGLTDQNGFPFLWEAMARKVIQRDGAVLG
ncbi:MAG: class II aldolase/adducin family protein [Proteobacteria bacterium]|nr:class II aldolase/adducin family protein [Pseudomonadota bacterium]